MKPPFGLDFYLNFCIILNIIQEVCDNFNSKKTKIMENFFMKNQRRNL